jgi:hypothetical protein
MGLEAQIEEFEHAEKSLVSLCQRLLNFTSLEPPDIEAP